MEDILIELLEVLPKNGEWKFNGQKERWLHAASLLIDMVLDKRKQVVQRLELSGLELSETRDIGNCGIIIIDN